jgi:ABC-type lipoprotein export system ATPase subunit
MLALISQPGHNGHGNHREHDELPDQGRGPDVERQPLIDVQHVEKAYQTPAGDFYALKGIDLQVQPGEFVAVVGKSGAGKSTLINMVTGIDRPTTGQVRVGSQTIQQMSEDRIAAWRGQNVGVIFQFFQLLPMLTCAQNVMLPMDFANHYHTTKERRERALYLLEQVGIPEQADKLPSAVSGGQRQRVAIARALANDPMFLAADEPTGNLDSKTSDAVFGVFERLVDTGKTILMVTHDGDLASRVDRVVRLADGEIVDTVHQRRTRREVIDA